ncbi:MAG: nuclear transport factor 2 family protein [Alphaproteobacteria bacterium]|nr:nuclear transport factor 2 family protein [Alphaproteobacteria bacterium]
MSAADIVQRQLDAYNAQDIDGFCGCFAADCVLSELNGAVTQTGLAAIRERYQTLFRAFPENHAALVNRVVVGNVVIDHEDITRSSSERINAVAIYTVKDGLIARVDFVRAP